MSSNSEDNPIVICSFCKRELPLDQAIDDGWYPCYFIGDEQQNDSVTCDHCAELYLDYPDEDGEIQLITDEKLLADRRSTRSMCNS